MTNTPVFEKEIEDWVFQVVKSSNVTIQDFAEYCNLGIYIAPIEAINVDIVLGDTYIHFVEKVDNLYKLSNTGKEVVIGHNVSKSDIQYWLNAYNSVVENKVYDIYFSKEVRPDKFVEDVFVGFYGDQDWEATIKSEVLPELGEEYLERLNRFL